MNAFDDIDDIEIPAMELGNVEAIILFVAGILLAILGLIVAIIILCLSFYIPQLHFLWTLVPIVLAVVGLYLVFASRDAI